jgi:hypothetical protein
LKGVLELSPLKRWTPQQALQHPFITQKPFTGPFQPDSQIIPHSPAIQSENGNSISFYKKRKKDTYIHHLGNHGKSKMRRRTQSMGYAIPPGQLQIVAQKMEGQTPTSKYDKRQEYSKKPPSESYRHRHTRSQGDYIGYITPDDDDNKSNRRVVKIAQQVRVRTGSHESYRVQQDNNLTIDGRVKINTRKIHAGEAAGGLLMMRHQDDAAAVTASKPPSKRLSDTFKIF